MMTRTYRALLRGNHLEWLGEKPESQIAAASGNKSRRMAVPMPALREGGSKALSTAPGELRPTGHSGTHRNKAYAVWAISATGLLGLQRYSAARVLWALTACQEHAIFMPWQISK